LLSKVGPHRLSRQFGNGNQLQLPDSSSPRYSNGRQPWPVTNDFSSAEVDLKSGQTYCQSAPF
jgi:hypothetical protein